MYERGGRFERRNFCAVQINHQGDGQGVNDEGEREMRGEAKMGDGGAVNQAAFDHEPAESALGAA